MTNIIFFSDSKCINLYPLNLGKCASTLHFGVRSVSTQWVEAIAENKIKNTSSIRLNSRLMPTKASVEFVCQMISGDKWVVNGETLAEIEGDVSKEVGGDVFAILTASAADYFELCGEGIRTDIERLKLVWGARSLNESERESWAMNGVFFHGDLEQVHISPGVKIRSCTINTESGDVIIGPHSEIMEGSCIRGPFALGDNSTVKMGSQIYGPTSIGQHCKVGGEVSNIVMHDYSNKGHGGFVGNSVIGSWCNLGAETTSSNLKNTYGEVKLYSAKERKLINGGRIFCGILMGDHSKTAIHTAFNTATVVGAFCNVFGKGAPEKHIPSFTWGGSEGVKEYRIEQAISTAKKVMARRNVELTFKEEAAIEKLFNDTSADRV